jgi:hypothetical protein
VAAVRAAVAADLAAVLIFVALGRTSHREGGAVAGFVTTAWPFLAGCVAGWLLILLARRGGRVSADRSMTAGTVVLAATVAMGMTLRRLFTGGGTPVSFLVVATTFLALFLLGWRLVLRITAGRRDRS